MLDCLLAQKIVAPHRQASRWRLITRAAGPAGTCDVRGVMLHLGPGASRKRVPPSPDVPSGNTLGSITRAVTSTLRPMQLPRQPHPRLAITRILRPLSRPTARRAAVPACPRFRCNVTAQRMGGGWFWRPEHR
jgi:hypothetical protein